MVPWVSFRSAVRKSGVLGCDMHLSFIDNRTRKCQYLSLRAVLLARCMPVIERRFIPVHDCWVSKCWVRFLLGHGLGWVSFRGRGHSCSIAYLDGGNESPLVDVPRRVIRMGHFCLPASTLRLPGRQRESGVGL